MAKLKPIKRYIEALTERCTKKYGEDFSDEYIDLIEVAARNKRLLDRFDSELDDEDLSQTVIGSTGQQKEDINVKVKHRNDVAKLYADNLDALFLTPRSKLKKSDNVQTQGKDEFTEYLSNIRQ